MSAMLSPWVLNPLMVKRGRSFRLYFRLPDFEVITSSQMVSVLLPFLIHCRVQFPCKGNHSFIIQNEFGPFRLLLAVPLVKIHITICIAYDSQIVLFMSHSVCYEPSALTCLHTNRDFFWEMMRLLSSFPLLFPCVLKQE